MLEPFDQDPAENAFPDPPEIEALPRTAETSDRPDDNLLPFPIVAIGGSAGGIETSIELFQHLPVNTGIAFVVVPHLARGNGGHFFEILARRSAIPVTMIEEPLRPQPNHVYVKPPHAGLSMRAGMLESSRRLEHGPHMVVDEFFHSIAADQKNRAIGVLLSGMDDDGALGLKAIKGEGGIAILQAPEPARFQNLPKGVAGAEYVDLVLASTEIGLELARLGSFYSSPELDALQHGQIPAGREQDFARILDLLTSVGNIDSRMYKSGIPARRVARRMLLKHLITLIEYLRYLEAHPRELRNLHEDLLFGATRFFRDRAVFSALQSELLPRLFESSAPRRQLRIWSVGCSTGEEVYSLAIAVLEALGSEAVLPPPIQIFGTDANDSAIRRARTGLFPETIAGEISPERLRRFFTKVDKGYQVSKRLRDLCIFARHDICRDPPFGQVDLISCRNVLAYLEPSLHPRIVAAFHYALRPGGFLLVGSSETLQSYADLFSVRDRKRKFYARLPSAQATLAGSLNSSELHGGLPLPSESVGDEWTDAEIQRKADQIVLARHSPPGLIVDENLEVRQTRSLSGSFLENVRSASESHLMQVLKASLASEVRRAMQEAIEKETMVQVPRVIVRHGRRSETISLEVLPLHGSSAGPRCFLVLFPGVQSERTQGLGSAQQQAANEEEIQSASEEVEAATQELHSVNEELEVIREELQTSNEELQQANQELQRRNAALGQATNDLSNLLSVLNFPLLVLDNELQVRRFSPMAERLMNLRTSDVGRPIRELRLNLDTEELEPLLLDVLETLVPRELEVQDRDGRWRLIRARPYRTSDNRIDGVVLVLLDIDELRSTQEELLEARDYSRVLIEAVPTPMAVLSMDHKIKHVNSAFRNLIGTQPVVFQQRLFPDLATRLWSMDEIGPRLAELTEPADESKKFEFQHSFHGNSIRREFRVWARTVATHSERQILVTIEEVTAPQPPTSAPDPFRGELESDSSDAEDDPDSTQAELRALAAHLFASQEKERRSVAGELHEDIGLQLAHLQIQMEELGRHLPESREKISSSLETLGHKTAAVSHIVRDISHRLHPSILDEMGLVEALKSLLDEFRLRDNLRTKLHRRNFPESVPDDIAGVLYRITQEALRYLAGSAARSDLSLLLEGTASALRMEISTVGSEIDLQELRTSLALLCMAERARLVQGVFSIESRVGGGAVISVEVPFAAD